jgi:hypothetical protein
VTDFDLLIAVLEGKLRESLPLWLDAIAHGHYTVAKRILNERVNIRAELQRLLESQHHINHIISQSGTQSDAEHLK